MIVVFITALCLVVRSQLRVENPGTLQIVLEDVVGFLKGILNENIGPKGPKYLPLIGTVGIFIFVAQHAREDSRLHVADREHQRHAGLRDHGVGLLPPDGHQGAGRRRPT